MPLGKAAGRAQVREPCRKCRRTSFRELLRSSAGAPIPFHGNSFGGEYLDSIEATDRFRDVHIDREVPIMTGFAVRPSARSARLVGALGGLAGVAASAAVVWHASYSAFSANTSNPTSNWTAGTVALSDDDSNTAMFTASSLTPNATGTKCIAVTSAASLPSAVKLYGAAPATTNGLSSYIDLTITQGTGGSSSNCSGFAPLGSGASVYSGTLAGFGSAATNFTNGVGSWTPTGSGSETRVYQFSYTLDPATPNSAQGGTAAIGFTWEAQNT
jgi:hypothetical protein